MKRALLLITLTFLASACNTHPTKQAELLKNVDKENVFPTPLDVNKTLKKETELVDKKVTVKFSKNDKFLLIKNKNTPVKKIQWTHTPSEKNKYLIFSGEMHNVGMAKSAAVFPELYIYNTQGKLLSLPMAQAGFDPMCGMFTCLKQAYNISKLPTGVYNLVLASYVEDPSKPIHMFATINSVGGVAGAIASSIDQEIFADYFGEVDLYYAEKKPFHKNNTSAVHYE